MATKPTQADAEEANKAAMAAFAAKRSPKAKAAPANPFGNLAANAARVEAARAVVTAAVQVSENDKTTTMQVPDWRQIAATVEGEILKHTNAASANNLAGKPRYTRKLSIQIDVDVT